MRLFTIFSGVVALLFLGFSAEGQNSEWRGPDRKGIFLEDNLLKSWPEGGPELLWSYEGLGKGHSSVGIGSDRVFVNGMIDTTGVLYSFDLKGNLLWKKTYGTEWHVNYTGTRSTPLVDDGRVYLESGMGEVFCFDAKTGEVIWTLDVIKKFNGNNIRWGVTESLLLYEDKLICTPGGEKSNVVALNRLTGETIWTSEGFGEPSAYCSPILVNHNGHKLVVTMTATSAIGMDAETGEMYWRVEQNQGNLIHANSPVYSDGVIYFSSSSAKTNGGLLALKLSDDAKKVTQLWRNESFKNLMGGIILIDGVIYGSKYRSSEWYAINSKNGKANLLTDQFGNGVILYADGHFYCYNENGEMALVKMTPDSFKIISKFNVPLGTDQHWAHPVIHDKRLYLRHGDALMVYDISNK